MRCDDTKLLLMDFLYDEIDAESERILRAHLESCQSCRAEYDQLNLTSLTLRAWEDEEPAKNMAFVEPQRSWLDSLKEVLYPSHAPLWGRLAFGGSIALLSALVVSALLNIEIDVGGGQLSYRASLTPRSNAELSPEFQNQLVQKLSEQNRSIVEDMIQTSLQDQRNEMNRTLNEFALQVKRQRQSDLQILGRGLEEVQQSTVSRLRRQDEMLNQLMRANFRP